MFKSRSPLAIIFVTVFIDLVGFGIVIPVLPLYAEKFHATPAVIGLLLASYSAMQFIFGPILGKLSDQVGRRPVLLVSILGTSVAFFITGRADLLWVLFLARIVDGITGANISTAQAYIADVTPPEKRSSGMGLIGAAFGLGFIFGPAIGGILSHISLAAPFYFASALAAANAVAIFFLLPESLSVEHRISSGRRASVFDVFRQSGRAQLKMVMATFFIATISFAMLTAIYALVTEKRFGYDARHNGYIFAYLGLIGAFIQGGLLRRLEKHIPDRTLAVFGIIILAISMAGIAGSTTVLLLLITSTGVAIGNSFATPTLNALASKSVGPSEQGRALGMMQSAASLARIIGPVLAGWLLGLDLHLEHLHYGRTPFAVGAVIMAFAFILAVIMRGDKAAIVEHAVAGAGLPRGDTE
ncbi:MAG TPA: MFS transporter [Blastocatellia bacterium]|nr:MFS transporter [Blastocatellia bacterium]